MSLAIHVVTCVACRSENVEGVLDPQGQWHGHCLTCGSRFWALIDHFPIKHH